MSEATLSTTQFDTLLKESRNIMLLCHSSPDADAMGSLLAMEHILKENYQKLFVSCYAETVSQTLSFLPGFHKVNYQGILQGLLNGNPDLVIFLDLSVWHMTSPINAQQIQDHITKNRIKTVVIDHHPVEIKTIDANLFIHRNDSSTCQTLFRIFVDELGLDISQETADCMLTGIISDTDRFKYHHDAAAYTFSILPRLLEKASMDIEDVTKILTRFPASVLKPLTLFMQNTITNDNGLTYATITEKDIQNNGLIKADISSAAKYYMSNMLLNLETTEYGFILYPFMNQPEIYTVSFRSASAEFNVKTLAEKLGGGGHEKASAARIRAGSSDEALEMVLKVIRETNPQ